MCGGGWGETTRHEMEQKQKKKTAKQLGITVYIFDMNETKLSLASSCTKLRPVKNFDFFF